MTEDARAPWKAAVVSFATAFYPSGHLVPNGPSLVASGLQSLADIPAPPRQFVFVPGADL